MHPRGFDKLIIFLLFMSCFWGSFSQCRQYLPAAAMVTCRCAAHIDFGANVFVAEFWCSKKSIIFPISSRRGVALSVNFKIAHLSSIVERSCWRKKDGKRCSFSCALRALHEFKYMCNWACKMPAHIGCNESPFLQTHARTHTQEYRWLCDAWINSKTEYHGKIVMVTSSNNTHRYIFRHSLQVCRQHSLS